MHFKLLKFLTVILGFLYSLINSDKRFVVLHLLELWVGFNICALNSTIELLIKHVHLFFMLILKIVYLHERVVLKLLELGFPSFVEVLKHFITNGNILLHLSLLNILS